MEEKSMKLQLDSVEAIYYFDVEKCIEEIYKTLPKEGYSVYFKIKSLEYQKEKNKDVFKLELLWDIKPDEELPYHNEKRIFSDEYIHLVVLEEALWMDVLNYYHCTDDKGQKKNMDDPDVKIFLKREMWYMIKNQLLDYIYRHLISEIYSRDNLRKMMYKENFGYNVPYDNERFLSWAINEKRRIEHSPLAMHKSKLESINNALKYENLERIPELVIEPEQEGQDTQNNYYYDEDDDFWNKSSEYYDDSDPIPF